MQPDSWDKQGNDDGLVDAMPETPCALSPGRLTAKLRRAAGVEDSLAGKTRQNNQSLCWRGAVATSAARGVSRSDQS